MTSARLDRIALLVFLVPVLALAGALFTEHVLGFPPCYLCKWQRVPYVLALGLGGFALAPWHAGTQRRLALGLAGILFLAGACIALFHAGVEAHWWAFESECTGSVHEAQTIEELRAMLSEAPVVRCDEVPFRVLGLSMAAWNAALQPWFGLAALWGAKRNQ
jgi:disulfide bond formation protein DsbB